MHLRSTPFVRALLVLALAAPLHWPASARATTVVPLAVEDLTQLSSDVVLGTVTRVESQHSPDRSQIFTYVTLAATQRLKGGGGGELTFVLWGGRVGDDVLRVNGSPGFRPGEQVVVFLGELPSRAPLARAVDGWLLGLANGKWSVTPDPVTGRPVARSGVPGAERALPLAELTARVVSAIRTTESNVIRGEGR
jgi:hypothetical protein